MLGSFLFHASLRIGRPRSVSYWTDECCRSRISNCLTLPSAPTDAKIFLSREKWMSYTSLSWAMSCVKTVDFSISQIVQVVSIEEVPIRLFSSGFQSKEVRGAEKSLSYNKVFCTFLRLSSRLTSLLSLIFQILRHSPEVANKSGLSPFWVA